MPKYRQPRKTYLYLHFGVQLLFAQRCVSVVWYVTSIDRCMPVHVCPRLDMCITSAFAPHLHLTEPV